MKELLPSIRKERPEADCIDVRERHPSRRNFAVRVCFSAATNNYFSKTIILVRRLIVLKNWQIFHLTTQIFFIQY